MTRSFTSYRECERPRVGCHAPAQLTPVPVEPPAASEQARMALFVLAVTEVSIERIGLRKGFVNVVNRKVP